MGAEVRSAEATRASTRNEPKIRMNTFIDLRVTASIGAREGQVDKRPSKVCRFCTTLPNRSSNPESAREVRLALRSAAQARARH
jgi:hypothetical protein